MGPACKHCLSSWLLILLLCRCCLFLSRTKASFLYCTSARSRNCLKILFTLFEITGIYKRCINNITIQDQILHTGKIDTLLRQKLMRRCFSYHLAARILNNSTHKSPKVSDFCVFILKITTFKSKKIGLLCMIKKKAFYVKRTFKV